MQQYTPEALAAWQADVIHTVPQVVATFGDNRFNDNENISASGTKVVNRGIVGSFLPPTFNFWSSNDAFNAKKRNTMRFGVLDQGATVDNNYRCVSVDYTNNEAPVYQRGWWSATKSDGSGNFVTPQFVQDIFTPRNINRIDLWFDDAYPNMKSVEVFYSPGTSYVAGANVTDDFGNSVPGPGSTNTWISLEQFNTVAAAFTIGQILKLPNNKTYTVQSTDLSINDISAHTGVLVTTIAQLNNMTALSPFRYSWQLPEQAICGLKVVIYSTDQPFHFARVIQLNGVLASDVSADVISFTVNQDKEEYQNTVPVGTTRANSCSIVLQNTQQQYSPENKTSPYWPYVTGNVELEISVGVDTTQGSATPAYEYSKLGHFYADTWTADSSGMTTTVSARDFSKFLIDTKLLFFGKIWVSKINPQTKQVDVVNVAQILTDIMARMGKAPDEIFIDPYALTTFDAVFLKDKIIWQFMAEVAFADQGMFGFDEQGNFFYTSYEALYTSLQGSPTSTTPLDQSVWNFSDSTNIISATEETEMYVNSVVANVYDYNIADTTTVKLWEQTDAVSLAYATLSNQITPSMGGQPLPGNPNANPGDRINVVENLDGEVVETIIDSSGQAIQILNPWAGGPPLNIALGNPNFYGENLLSTGYNSGGYLYIDQEIIQYGARDSHGFYQLTRGILDTPVQFHAPGAYIGEVKVWNPITFTNSPAYFVNPPHCTAIDDISIITNNAFKPLAKYLVYRPNAFGAVLAIGNVQKNWVLLSGSSQYNFPYSNGTIDWVLNISGSAIIPKQSKEEVGGPPIGRATSTGRFTRYIKKFGKNETVIDNPWVQSVNRANYLVNLYLTEYKTPRQLININCLPFPYLQLTDMVTITSSPSMGITNHTYNIVGIDYTYDGSLQANVLARETVASATNV